MLARFNMTDISLVFCSQSLTVRKEFCKLKPVQLGEPKTTRALETMACEELELFSLERRIMTAVSNIFRTVTWERN